VALPLEERAWETDSAEPVRMTLIAGGAAAHLAEALIPARPLEAGEQYRFHFNMTKCIGCRSCEIACSEQNGNPADIHWRRVGELEGGIYPETQRTYLSMGCNHCLSADCLKGCPVDAYTKDPATGIVLHSAEACIGCQYCVWNCPYSVPQFNPERGVVGKCDMCRDRLLDGREPACVNACPENAIQIEIVDKEAWREDYAMAESPGMPPAGQTISTTRITLPPASTSWLQRVDTGTMALEHAHPSLVLMTCLMQAAVGTLCFAVLDRTLDVARLTLLLILVAVALNVAVLHLGRPLYAWRALKMWKRSWLSREVLLFGCFFTSTAVCTSIAWLGVLRHQDFSFVAAVFAGLAAVLGLAGTLASAYIYRVRARPAWNMVHTPIDFLLSCGLLGAALCSAMSDTANALLSEMQRHGLSITATQPRGHILADAAIVIAWIGNQGVRLLRLRASANFESRASFNLLRGERLWWRVALSWMSAAATLLFLAAPLPWMAVLTALSAVLLNRYLFFVSVVPLSMGLTFLRKTTDGHEVAA
jgi:DMSO reductase iron-sulfur subunit